MSLSRRHLLHAAGLATLAPALPGCAGPAPPLDQPHLANGFAPVPDELDLAELPVRGEIPRDLAGTWLRNGPNPAYQPISYVYPWDGDGMVHALRFRDGKVAYANRFIATKRLAMERQAGHALFGSLMRPAKVEEGSLPPGTTRRDTMHLANTSVVHHAGKTLALWEGGLPYELDAQLATRGEYDFGGRLRGAMTAHPKFDPATGEMLVLRYAPQPPFLSFGSVNAAGEMTRMEVLATDQPYMVHDFICTRRYAVFVLCPVLFGPQFAGLQANGTVRGPVAWEPGLGTRIAVLDRQAAPGAGPWRPPAGAMPAPGATSGPRPIERPAAPLRWFSAEAFFTFHFLNAFERDGRIHVDQVRYPALPGQGFPQLPSLWRLTLNLADGSTSETQLDDRRCEFPRIDGRRAGLPNRFGWLPVKTTAGGDTVFPAIVRYDLDRGEVAVHDFGAGQEVDEPAFLPRPGGTTEGDGWILTYVYDRATDRSRAVLLDAIDIAAPPLAEISLPRRVPHGLHGNWLVAA